MAQHFLLDLKAKTLSSYEVAQISKAEAFDVLCNMRWGSKENVVCAKCGVQHKAYFISTCKQWPRKHCKRTFSVTSGTIFASHKLPLKTYLYILILYLKFLVIQNQLSHGVCDLP